MSIQNRITYDSSELISMLEKELDKFNTFRFDSRYKELLGARLVEKFNKWDSVIRKQKDLPLTLVVCGEFKRGKSSLINALLGEDVVTTNVTTETITTNVISYGAHSNEIILSGGKRVRLSDEELNCDELSGILGELPEKATRLELKRPIEALKDLIIIDTPGLGDSLQDFADDVYKALQQADAVIYVYSVSYPISVQEQLFIKTVIKPQRYTDLFMVGNYADMLDSVEECEKVKAVTCKRINDFLPDEKPILLSSLDERSRQLGANRPNDATKEYLENGFSMLRNNLAELLESKRDCIIPDRIERLLCNMLSDISVDIEALSQGLSFDENEIKDKMNKLEADKNSVVDNQAAAFKKVDKVSDIAKAESTVWMESFIDKMMADTDSLLKYDVEDVKRYYSLFCIDTLQEAIGLCSDYFIKTVYKELDEISEEISKSFSLAEVSSSSNIKFSVNNKSWTTGDTVAFMAESTPLSSIVSSVPMLSFALKYVAGSMRSKKIKDDLPEVVKEIKEQYPSLKLSAIKALSDTYNRVIENCKKQISEYFVEKIDEYEARLEQCVTVARQDEESKNSIKLAIEEIQKVFDSINETVANIQLYVKNTEE